MDNLNTVSFEGKSIRKTWHNEEWFFSVIDVIEVLSKSPEPRKYWVKVKNILINENQLSPIWRQLKIEAPDGKNRSTDCANTAGIFRIIMSVPSPNAEPLKLWLAQTGAERIEETEDPELGFERMKKMYRAKGYSDKWIEERIKSIETRNLLTEEWKKRNVQKGQEFSVLTAIIAKETFDVTPSEHRRIKELTKPSDNLRDNMTRLELIFMSLGEELTREETIKDDAQGFSENAVTAQRGGSYAGDARRAVEEKRGKKIVSSENFLPKPKKTDSIEGEK